MTKWMVKVIEPSGLQRDAEVDLTNLREVAKLIDETEPPWIGIVRGHDGLNDVRIYLDDEGLLRGRPVNRAATVIYGGMSPIVGTVVLATEFQFQQAEASFEEYQECKAAPPPPVIVKLNGGEMVLGVEDPKSGPRAKVFTNRTQAQAAAVKAGGEVIQRGRPFYVRMPKSNPKAG